MYNHYLTAVFFSSESVNRLFVMSQDSSIFMPFQVSPSIAVTHLSLSPRHSVWIYSWTQSCPPNWCAHECHLMWTAILSLLSIWASYPILRISLVMTWVFGNGMAVIVDGWLWMRKESLLYWAKRLQKPLVPLTTTYGRGTTKTSPARIWRRW